MWSKIQQVRGRRPIGSENSLGLIIIYYKRSQANRVWKFVGTDLHPLQVRGHHGHGWANGHENSKFGSAKFGLFVVNPYKANNLFSDDYMNSLGRLGRIGHGWANGHENSKFGSGNSHCSSSTLLRPTTPKTTTTAWTTSLQRVQFPLTNTDKSALSNMTKKFILFLEIRIVLRRPFWGQQPQKRRLLPNQPRLSESSTFSLSNETKKLALSTASSLYIPN